MNVSILTDSNRRRTDQPERTPHECIENLEIKPGLTLSILNFDLNADVQIDFKLSRTRFVFGYFLSGQAQSRFQHSHSPEMNITASGGFNGVSFLHELGGSTRYQAKQTVTAVHIGLDPETLRTMLPESRHNLPVDLQHIVEGKVDREFHHSGQMTAGMQLAIRQMLTAPFRDLTRHLYLESKTIELIALQLGQLELLSSQPLHPSKLQPLDIERIHSARDLIARQMKDPPSLMELARTVGLNDFKLKKGFRQLFGQSVFGYLHGLRMAKALQMLEEDRLNIKEISFAIGYKNAHSFSDAFKKYYGLRPNHYRNCMI